MDTKIKRLRLVVFAGKEANRMYRYAAIGKMTVIAGVIYGIYKLGEKYEERRISKVFKKNR